MENFKRSAKRLLTRLTILGLVVICGAIAIAQVQKQNIALAAEGASEQPVKLSFAGDQDTTTAGIPVNGLTTTRQEPARWNDSISTEPVEPSDRFVHDAKVAVTQAVEDLAGGVDQPSFSQGDAAPSPPRFSDAPRFDDAPKFSDTPEFSGDVPELLGGNDVPAPPTDGPSAPAPGGRFGNDFPAADVEFPRSSVSDTSIAAPPSTDRFENATDFGADEFSTNTPGRAHPLRNNTQAQTPRTHTSAASRFGPTEQTPRASLGVATRAQPSNVSFDSSGDFDSNRDFGSNSGYDTTVSQVEAQNAYPENSVNISGSGRPDREYDGPQSASVTIQKMAPQQVRVGEPATFTIKVRNNGNIAADRVIVRDQVPEGTRLAETNPIAKEASGGGIYWEVGTLPAGQESTFTMQVIPEKEATIGSVAVVSFETMASAQAEARRPMLEINHTTTKEVLVGETVRFAIVIENPGSGTAKDVTVEEDVPQGLSHSSGPALKYKVGDIRPSEQRRLELSLKAAKPGLVTNIIRARGANGLLAEHKVELQVVAPQLEVGIQGPSLRYLERPATYEVLLGNRGTAAAENINLNVQLPPGLKFVSTESSGRYDASSHSVRWLLRKLPAGEGASVKLTVNPNQVGQFNLNAMATADRGLRDEKIIR